MLWVGQFGILNGEAKEETPWVGAFTDPSYSEDRSDLYVIVEPALPGSEEFCGELKEAVGEVFHKEKLSLTGGILRALRSAHENLRDWNRKSIKEHQVAAGISCLAMRGTEAYLGQVSPSSVFLYRSGTVLPVSPRLPDAREPLGLHEEFLPDFSRFQLEADDRLLLVSPSLAETLDEQQLARALELPPQEALPELYRQASGTANCGALLVACLPDEELR
jgi:serine/threonine protein phosphatase PrpC